MNPGFAGTRTARLGRAALLTLIAGTVGGAAVLAGAGARGPVPHLRASRTSGWRCARPIGPYRARRRCGWCCSATPPRSASGSSRVDETVGGQLARLLAEGGPTGSRRVHLSSVGVSGSRSVDLATQVARALLGPAPDVAVILIGANDVTDAAPAAARPPPTSARRFAGCAPPASRWSSAPARTSARSGRSPPPLRQIAGLAGAADRRGRRPRRSAAAGGTVVDLAAETGPVFRADAGTLCDDGFHPSGRRLPGLGARAAPRRLGGSDVRHSALIPGYSPPSATSYRRLRLPYAD